MGHYDTAYADEDEKRRKAQREHHKALAEQIKAFRRAMPVTNIPQRFLDSLDDWRRYHEEQAK